MKTRFLFPNKWRPAGLVLLFIAVTIVVYNSFYAGHYNISTDPGEIVFGKPLSDTAGLIINDIEYLSVIIGLLLVGFSKLKIEDEQIAQLRLDSLQWSVYVNYGLLIICIIAVNGIDFLTVMAYNIMTQLLFFVVRFRWKLYQLNRLTRSADEAPVLNNI